MKSNYQYFFVDFVFVSYLRNLCLRSGSSQRLSLMFSSRSFMVLAFTFGSPTHLEFIHFYIQSEAQISALIFFSIWISSCSGSICDKHYHFPISVIAWYFVKNQLTIYTCVYLHYILLFKKILFIFVYARSLLLCVGFLQLRQVVASLIAEHQLHLVAQQPHSTWNPFTPGIEPIWHADS